MEILQNVFYFLVAIAVLVAVHEAGHFFMARACGVYVERFSLGFGPVLCSFKGKTGTEYSLSLIPLGGYVKMYGESVDENGEGIEDTRSAEAFSKKKVWQRFLIVAAGPFCNIVLAWLLYSLMFVIGVQDFKPVFDVKADSPAAVAGMQSGDVIKSINGTEVADFEEAIYHLLANIGDSVVLKVAGDLGRGPVRTVSLSLAAWKMDPEQREFMKDLGLEPKQVNASLVLAHVEKGSAAQKAGFTEFDRLVAVDGRKIQSWGEISADIRGAAGKTLEVTIERGSWIKKDFLNSLPAQMLSSKDKEELKQLEAVTSKDVETLTLNLKPDTKERDGEVRGYAGVAPYAFPVTEAYFQRRYGIIDSTVQGLKKTADMSLVTFRIIKKFLTGDISPKNVSGPIGIAKGAGLTARLGFEVFIGFMALISVNLGVLNLLPVPVLDGGHLFFYIIEAIRGRPLPEKLMSGLMKTGLILLLMLMALAMFNDIYFNW